MVQKNKKENTMKYIFTLIFLLCFSQVFFASQQDSWAHACIYAWCVPCVKQAVDAKYALDNTHTIWLHVCQHVYGDLYPNLSAQDRRDLLEKCENNSCGRKIDRTYVFNSLHAYRRACDVFNIKVPSHTTMIVDGDVWEFGRKSE